MSTYNLYEVSVTVDGETYTEAVRAESEHDAVVIALIQWPEREAVQAHTKRKVPIEL